MAKRLNSYNTHPAWREGKALKTASFPDIYIGLISPFSNNYQNCTCLYLLSDRELV